MDNDAAHQAIVLLQQAIAALRTQDQQTARPLLAQAILLNPNHDQAWLWLSGVVTSTAERRYCLEKALHLNPNLTIARRSLELLPPGEATIPTLLTRHSSSPPAFPPSPSSHRPVSRRQPQEEEPFAPVALLSAAEKQRTTQSNVPSSQEPTKKSVEPERSTRSARPKAAAKTTATQSNQETTPDAEKPAKRRWGKKQPPLADTTPSPVIPGLEGIVVAQPRKKNMLLIGGVVGGVVLLLVFIVVVVFPFLSGLYPDLPEDIASERESPTPEVVAEAPSPTLPVTLPITSTETITETIDTTDEVSKTIDTTDEVSETIDTTDEVSKTTEPADEPTETLEPVEEPDEPTETLEPTNEPTEITKPTDEPTATLAPTVTPVPTATPMNQTTTGQSFGYVINGGNMRSEPRAIPATVIGQICPGDQIRIIAEQTGWTHFVVSKTAADCNPQRVKPDTEGWAASSLIKQLAGEHPADYPELPSALPVAIMGDVETGAMLRVTMGGQSYRIHLIGIDAPAPTACFGPQAITTIRRLLQETETNPQFVLLETDDVLDDTDESGALLRYVWLPNGKLLNAELLRLGQARLDELDNYTYKREFSRFVAAARSGEEGLWKPGVCP